MARMSIATKRVKVPEVNYRFATGTTKKAPKEWEDMVGVEFINYILKKVKE
jgi:hypothetical protein